MRAYTSLRTLKQAGAKVLNGLAAFFGQGTRFTVENCVTSKKGAVFRAMGNNLAHRAEKWPRFSRLNNAQIKKGASDGSDALV
jgi:hypothetical protein